MASILCPKCKNPLSIPKPAPEKIFCASCGASFRNQAYKPDGNGSSAALASASQDSQGLASPHVAQKLAGPPKPSALPVPVAALAGAAAGAGAAQAVAEPRVAKTLAGSAPAAEPDAAKAAGPAARSPNKAALIMGAGGAAAVVILAVVVWAMVKGNSPKKDDSGTSANKEGGKSRKFNLQNEPRPAGQEEVPFDPKKAAEEIDELLKKEKDDSLNMEEKERLEALQQQMKVHNAIEKGVNHLRSRIPPLNAVHYPLHGGDSNTRAGAVALLGLTLLSCGATPDDADVQKVADIVREVGPKLRNPYDIAPAIFFLDRLYKEGTPTADDKKLINTLGLRLVAGQRRPMHLWRYDTVPNFGPEEEEALKDKLEKKTFQGPFTNFDVDMSCSQFAALGLWTASRHGIKQDNDFDPLKTGAYEGLKRAALQAREQENIKQGTWNYSVIPTEGAFQDTSTCCGLILVCLGEAVKEKPQPFLEDEAVANALKHLEKVMRDNKDPGKFQPKAIGKYYFLWALERTALILGLEKIGDEDWHKWGAGMILPQQHPGTGGWHDGGLGDVCDTCFALLFLKRINLFKDLTQKLTRFAMAPVRRLDMASAPPAPRPVLPPHRPRSV